MFRSCAKRRSGSQKTNSVYGSHTGNTVVHSEMVLAPMHDIHHLPLGTHPREEVQRKRKCR
jgi:hypothetical protein